MCETGRVLLNGLGAKPAKEVKSGDRITLLFGAKSIELEVAALPVQKSVRKANAADLYRVTGERRIEHEDQPWIKSLS